MSDVELEHRFDSGGNELVSYLARPEHRPDRRVPGLVMCHGFPSGGAGGPSATSSAYLTLADRIADDLGWTVLALNYRGCGGSGGDFSVGGWFEDTRNALDEVSDQPEVGAIWIAGFGTGELSASLQERPTNASEELPPLLLRPTSTTGVAILAACCCTAVGSA